MKSKSFRKTAGASFLTTLAACTFAFSAEPGSEAPYLADRGPGLATSQPGVYVREGEFLLHPFFLYTSDNESEYVPEDFGFTSPTGEFKGTRDANGGTILLAYGFTDRIAAELRATQTRTTLKKAPEDLTGMPNEVKESGLSDTLARLTWRARKESDHGPEIFFYEDALLPHDSGKPLIGTPDFIFETGIGISRGHSWGTLTYRAGFFYEPGSETHIDFGDITVEYLKRVSPRATFFGAFRTTQGDEGYLVGQVMWDFNPRVALRVLGQRGFTSVAADTTAQAGIVVRFR